MVTRQHVSGQHAPLSSDMRPASEKVSALSSPRHTAAELRSPTSGQEELLYLGLLIETVRKAVEGISSVTRLQMR